MDKMLKPCLYIAGGIVGIITGIKLLFLWDRSRDSPPQSPTHDNVKNDDEYDLNSFKLKIYKAGKPYNTTTFAYSINDSRSKVFHEPHMFNQQLEISNVDACIITVDMVKVFGLVQVSMGLNQAKLAMSKLNAKYFIATGIAPKRTKGLISYLLSINESYQEINLMPASCQQVGDSLSL